MHTERRIGRRTRPSRLVASLLLIAWGCTNDSREPIAAPSPSTAPSRWSFLDREGRIVRDTVDALSREELEELWHSPNKTDQVLLAMNNLSTAKVLGGFPEWSQEEKRSLGVTDVGIAHLVGAARELQFIHLPHCDVTDAGLRKLASLGTLKVLVLGSAPVTAGGIAEFRTRRQDCALRLFPEAVLYKVYPAVHHPSGRTNELPIEVTVMGRGSDEIVEAISQFSEVNVFTAELRGKGGDRRIGENCNLSNASLGSLSTMPLLERIRIMFGEYIDDDGLAMLAGHHRLREIYVEGVPFSRRAREKFRDSNPRCRVRP